MKRSTKTHRKEIYWSDLAGDFPNLTMKQAFQTEVAKCVGLGLMEHLPRADMSTAEIAAFRAAFLARRQR